MDQKKLLLIVGAGIVALGTGIAAKSMFSSASAPVVQAIVAPKGPRVLVAQRMLPVGTIITADAISFQAWPKDMVRDAYFLDDNSFSMNKLIGTVVRYPITAGQPLTQSALVAPGDRGFLAAALTPGMRAITIPVSDKSSVAGFVFPGDHVDLMLTQKVVGVDMTNPQPLNVTETILRNLRVLATDQSPTTEKTADGKTDVHTFHTVTLEVSPRIAEKIEVAQSIGSIDMTLRAIADSQGEMDKAIANGTVKLTDKNGQAETTTVLTNTNNRPVEGATSFSTGGDVSRFQRRSMPANNAGATVKKVLDSTLGHTGTGIGVKVIRGSDVSEPTDGGTGMMGAVGNLLNNYSNGARRAGRTMADTAPASAMGN